MDDDDQQPVDLLFSTEKLNCPIKLYNKVGMIGETWKLTYPPEPQNCPQHGIHMFVGFLEKKSFPTLKQHSINRNNNSVKT